ncbi:hypothetical protein AWE51_16390 [Aquimarina aggregata]|uniref:Uncharacterized protein n=1 Tax=Aquimarina aggregata TaxID=1642818 RepID=A0A163D1Q9_9FLAO|nr:hypothetical protein [Aquimarina aggregata]KZS42930.1 hypothetical protein AWE51_16390 [Aquimarina aggregata]
MKSIKTVITVAVLMTNLISCGQQSDTEKNQIKQSFVAHTPTSHHEVALEVLNASKNWIMNFNSGNAAACIKGYDTKAIMRAMPFGIKKGVSEISGFWKPFISSGATNLIYTNVSIEVVNKTTAFLSANWSMNLGKGIIYQEKWERINGKWLLTYDDFEVLEKFETPIKNDTNPVANHIILEEVIQASIKWTNSFNSGDNKACGNGYAKNAFMNAVPFTSIQGKEVIEDFWTKLINDGTKNLTYHNPTFKVKTDKSATLSSQWSMNIGEGKIYQEKWEQINGKWLLTYDEFQVLKQY